MAIDPTGDGLKRFLEEDPGGPVVMLNLLRFREGGEESYARYSQTVGGSVLARYGAEVLYYGKGSTALVAEDGQAWDAVLLVRYPSREVFCQMIADPEFQSVSHFRSEALTEAVLQATIPLTPRG
jgi:uncharacterized protein (DUF1330 family)